LVTSPILYSVNPYLKFHIQQKYRGNSHFVWCAEVFDSSKASHYQTTARTPASSDPCSILADLKKAVETSDTHCSKIREQRLSLKKLAKQWESGGEISKSDRTDIVFRVEKSPLEEWRPLLYLVLRDKVASRMKAVPAAKCAGLGNEWTIADLMPGEFDVIEL
jgi:hypothetical protein